MLFVPPCGKSFQANEQFRLYYCPASRRHRDDVRYLGVYANRTVRSIGEVARVVTCSINIDARTVAAIDGDGALTVDERNRIVDAAIEARNRGWDISTKHRFYLCNEMEPTDFQKSSSQGIWNRRYFDLEGILGAPIPQNLGNLAEALRDHTWI